MFGKFLTMGAMGVLALAVNAQAVPITYVDVIHGSQGTQPGNGQPTASNTALASGGVFDDPAGGIGSGLTGSQYQGADWDWRAFGNRGVDNDVFPDADDSSTSIYQDLASGEGLHDTPRLATTISGLTPGSEYKIYVYFWSNTASWRVRAAVRNTKWLKLFAANDGAGSYVGSVLSDGPVISLGAEGGGLNVSEVNGMENGGVGALHFTPGSPGKNPLTGANLQADISDGDRRLMEGVVARRVVADLLGNIVVYLDGDDRLGNAAYDSLIGLDVPAGASPGGTTDASNYRAWIDGVGYELVPEPASLALLGLGGLAMISRRRA